MAPQNDFASRCSPGDSRAKTKGPPFGRPFCHLLNLGWLELIRWLGTESNRRHADFQEVGYLRERLGLAEARSEGRRIHRNLTPAHLGPPSSPPTLRFCRLQQFLWQQGDNG